MQQSNNPGASKSDLLLADAIERLAAVFDTVDLEYIRNDLWQWLKAVTSDEPWSFMGNPAEVVRLKRLFGTFINIG
eukprot:gene4018-5306_t